MNSVAAIRGSTILPLFMATLSFQMFQNTMDIVGYYVGFFINNGQQTLEEMPYYSIVFFVLYLNNPDRSMFL